jgi:4-hydroxythreonine-4-phosphate dehydrogenase
VITRLALTPGEPAGIGPDLCIKLAQHPPDAQLVVVGDQQLMAQRAAALDLPLTLVPFDEFAAPRRNEAGELFVCNVALAEPAHPGRLNAANSPYVLNTLEVATSIALRKQVHALVTGPVHKGVINEAGIPFSGHTEFLAQQCEVDLTVMMLATEGLRVALATTHLPRSLRTA